MIESVLSPFEKGRINLDKSKEDLQMAKKRLSVCIVAVVLVIMIFYMEVLGVVM